MNTGKYVVWKSEKLQSSWTLLVNNNWKQSVVVILCSLIYNTNATRVRHKYYTNNKSTTWLKNFDFVNDTSENIFSHPYIYYIYYMEIERLQREEQFNSKDYLLEMACSYGKMRLKSAPQKLNFVMSKAISTIYTLDCSCKYPCTFPHSYV